MGYFELLFLLLYIALILCGCYVTSKRILITPEFVITICFVPQIAYALFYVEKWDLDLDIRTLVIYILGIGSFFVFSILFRRLFFSKKMVVKSDQCVRTRRKIKKWKLIAVAIFQLFSIFVMARAIKQVTQCNNLFDAINSYSINSKNSGMRVSSFAGKLNLFSYLSGFAWMYYLGYSFVYKERGRKLLYAINLMLSFVSNLLTGSRGGIVQVCVSGFFLFYLLWQEKNRWKKKISLKTYILIILIALLIVVSFKPALLLLGRTTSIDNFFDYVALYLSAEIKNLDIRVSEGVIGYKSFWEWGTLNSLISKVLNVFGIEGYKQYADTSTYITYKGMKMGNVYTIFYPFVSDLGYIGVVLFCGIMAFICQFFFKRATTDNSTRYRLHMSKLIYSYMLVQLFFSFFSNWFYNSIFSTGFVWCVIVWYFFRYLLEGDFRMLRFRKTVKSL